MNAPGRFDPAFLAQLESLRLHTRKRFSGQVPGERRSARHGAGLEFVDFRPYAQGDELRHVDWNIYGRLDRLVVKLFGEERDLCLHLLIDTSASMTLGTPTKLDCALRAGAALGYIALANHERLALGLLGESLRQAARPRSGRRQIYSILEQLGRVEGGGRTALGPSLARYAARSRTPGVAIVISDLLDGEGDQGYQAGLRALLARGFDVQVLHVLAEDELDPPLEGDLRVLDLEAAGVESAHDGGADITFEARSRTAYVRNLERFCADAQQFCLRRSMAYLRISSAMPLETLLLQRLRERRFLL